MRVLVHLSDLHFGRVDPTLLDPLVTTVQALAPDLIAVSGDLTQRARTSQFIAARTFLDRLPIPQIVVPGNHDVPLYDLITRFIQPLARYRRYVAADLEPWFADDEIAVLGINTARSLTFKGGRINATQIDRAEQRLGTLADSVTRVIVTHHPFNLPPGYDDEHLVGRAALASEMLLACKCDLLLAGHLHVGTAASGSLGRNTLAHQPIIVQAGSATSTRVRGEPNSFNVIVIEPRHIEIKRYAWQLTAQTFDSTGSEHFERTGTGWEPQRGGRADRGP